MQLLQAARQHSVLMAKARKLSHQLPGESDVQQRLAATGAHFGRSGENVGFNDQVDQIHAAFMHSPPHRENLLTPGYDAVGIGIVRQGNNYWVTEDFATLAASISPDQATTRAAQAFAELRAQAQLPGLKLVQLPQLRETVCTMAKAGNMSNRPLLQIQGARYTVTYTNPHPEVLPPEMDSHRESTSANSLRRSKLFRAGRKRSWRDLLGGDGFLLRDYGRHLLRHCGMGL